MKFDTIIIGGGLSSLVCGIRLQKRGSRCLIVSTGQNAMHFSSGTFGLLGRLSDGTDVMEPLKALFTLGKEHPYSKIGTGKVIEYCSLVPEFFSDCGVALHGVAEEGNLRMPRNGFRLTPLGTMRPAWLAMKDTTLLSSREESLGAKALVVNFSGFLDFHSSFIAEGLEKRGLECRQESVRIRDLEALRRNPSEMRSVGIARVMDREENWKEFGAVVRETVRDEDLVVLPEVFGLGDPRITDWLRQMIPARVMFIGTMPPSVPGIRTQMLLKKAFEASGGTFLMGDTATGPDYDGDRVRSLRTVNLGSMPLEADNFVLASGGLFGKGIEATPTKVSEPVFGLDVDYPLDRSRWCDPDFFRPQPYASFGVRTDERFIAMKDGHPLGNLYVIGSEVGGCDPLSEGSGAGVAILTAMSVSDSILEG